ncbi:MAG: PilZ domain-containing protein [Deltaproteobacteria bacterium]|nr:PilZ domain-containing protein [Deltaproteobacteria bacterium]
MTEPTITQDQIDALLKEVAIEDRIQNQYERIELKIDQLLSQTQSKDLTAAKAALGRQMAFVTRNNSESQDTAPKLRDEMKKLAIDLLGLTNDIGLFERIVKLQTLIGLNLYRVKQDRRQHPRFPLTVDVTLKANGNVHRLYANDISSIGLSLIATEKLPVGRRYGLIFSSLPDQEHQIDVLRVRKMPQDQLLIYQAACTYANLLPWATIRKIIESVVQ